MKRVLFISFLFLAGPLHAQPKYDTLKCFFDPMPEFPGGQDSLLRYLFKNLIYPQTALEEDIEGRIVVRFLIRTDGSVDSITIVRGHNSALEREVIRVMTNMPKWIPANGQKQNVWWTIPIFIKPD